MWPLILEDTLDVPLDPLGPLAPGQVKTRNVARELQTSTQFTPGLVFFLYSLNTCTPCIPGIHCIPYILCIPYIPCVPVLCRLSCFP